MVHLAERNLYELLVPTMDVQFLFRLEVLVEEFASNRLVLNVDCVSCLDLVFQVAWDFWQPVLVCDQEAVVKIAQASFQAYFRVDCVYYTSVTRFSCGLLLDYIHGAYLFLEQPTLGVSEVDEFSAADSSI